MYAGRRPPLAPLPSCEVLLRPVHPSTINGPIRSTLPHQLFGVRFIRAICSCHPHPAATARGPRSAVRQYASLTSRGHEKTIVGRILFKFGS
ncbi:unnamed protein product [Urochloa humidicola]